MRWRQSDGGIPLSAVGCPLSVGGETIRQSDVRLEKRFEERDLRFEGASVRCRLSAFRGRVAGYQTSEWNGEISLMKCEIPIKIPS